MVYAAPYRVRLRPGLKLEETSPPPGSPPDRRALRLIDRPQGVRLRFDASQKATLDLLDGARTADEVVAAAEARGVSGDETRAFLLTLMFTGLLVGIDDARRSAHVEARASGPALVADLPFELITSTRFACGSCGECCRSYRPGPLTEDEVNRILDSDFVKTDPEYKAVPLFLLTATPDGHGGLMEPSYSIRSRPDGSCIFLMKDGRCRVHHELGYAAKPDVCKLFPWMVTPTERSLVVADRTECQTFHRSSNEGPSLEERFDEVRDLLRGRPQSGIFSPPIALAGNVVVAYQRFRPVVQRLVSVLDEGRGGFFERLLALRNALGRFVGLVHGAPIAPGAPEGVLAAFEAVPVEDHFGAEAAIGLAPDRERFVAALRRVLERLARGADRIVTEGDSPGLGTAAKARLPMVVEPQLLPSVREAFRAGLAVLRGEQPGAPVDLRDPVLDGAFLRAVRQRIHGHELEIEGSVAAGFARVLLVVLATVGAARARAAARGAARVEPEDFDRGQFTAVRGFMTRSVRNALREDEDDLAHLFHHATDLETIAAS